MSSRGYIARHGQSRGVVLKSRMSCCTSMVRWTGMVMVQTLVVVSVVAVATVVVVLVVVVATMSRVIVVHRSRQNT